MSASTPIEVGGRRVQIVRAGAGEPLLYLHGVGFDFPWLPFHDRLARRFEVAVPVHPGFGDSEGGETLDGVEDLVFHELDVLGVLGWERIHLVGASLGGWVAAELAVRHPGRVRRLVLIDAAGLHVEEAPAADLFALKPRQLAPLLFHDLSHPVAQAILGFNPNDPSARDLALERYKAMTALARVGWNPYLHDPKLRGRLGRITAPTLVLWGASDRVIPPAHGEVYRDLIPGARLEVLPDCGHIPALEQPEPAAQRIVRFLSG